MKITSSNNKKDERGFVLVAALLVLAIVTAIGIAATTTSTIELQVSGNTKQTASDFYITEGSLIDTMETPGNWLTTSFLTAGETAASYTGNIDLNSDGTNDATVEIRCIEDTSTAITGLSSSANNLPVRSHRGSPPSGSGYSLKHFEVHRYGITVTSTAENSQIQAGVWKIFNKSQ
jgi:Tfp pilus assembly protein PilX